MRCSIWRPSKPHTRSVIGEATRSLCEDEEHLLTIYAFPPVIHRSIHGTNAIESFAEHCSPTYRSG